MKRSRLRPGYTLIEMAVAISVGLMVAVMVLALVNQQVAFTRIFNTQNFLTAEAPVISETLGTMCGRADGFRLYGSTSDALAGTQPLMADAAVAELRFRHADGSLQRALLSWEDIGDGPVLNYYLVSAAGTIGSPNIRITGKPSRVRFAVEGGLLRMRLTGRNGEEITYCATTQT
jgi:hypothetical protein